ncbi:hypothetical protein Bbelb_160840 [Branchiostoma belcheri]|nr:hypothetical protein Bbelb_160840 [Branchiostoma belcheri]
MLKDGNAIPPPSYTPTHTHTPPSSTVFPQGTTEQTAQTTPHCQYLPSRKRRAIGGPAKPYPGKPEYKRVAADFLSARQAHMPAKHDPASQGRLAPPLPSSKKPGPTKPKKARSR